MDLAEDEMKKKAKGILFINEQWQCLSHCIFAIVQTGSERRLCTVNDRLSTAALIKNLVVKKGRLFDSSAYFRDRQEYHTP